MLDVKFNQAVITKLKQRLMQANHAGRLVEARHLKNEIYKHQTLIKAKLVDHIQFKRSVEDLQRRTKDYLARKNQWVADMANQEFYSDKEFKGYLEISQHDCSGIESMKTSFVEITGRLNSGGFKFFYEDPDQGQPCSFGTYLYGIKNDGTMILIDLNPDSSD